MKVKKNQSASLIYFLMLSVFSCEKAGEVDFLAKKMNLESLQLQQFWLEKSIPIGFKHTLNQCFLSDHDLILEDMKQTQTSNVILVAEDLFDFTQSKAASSLVINPNNYKPAQLSFGYFSSFLPPVGLYGIFICTDKGKVNSCKSKNGIIYQNYTVYLFSKNSDKKRIQIDKNFYFKPILVGTNKVYPLHSEDQFKKAFEYIGRIKGIPAKKVKAMHEHFHSLFFNLGNYKLGLGKKHLVLDVAQIDPVCDVDAHKEAYRSAKPGSAYKIYP